MKLLNKKTHSSWINIALISILSFSLQGCFSTSMMSTAKTLDKSEQQFSVGVSGYYFDGDSGGVGPDFLYRRGISDKFDFGVGYSMGLYGHLRADIKYELISWDNAFLSTGLGADFYLPDDFGDDQLLGSTIPLYFSFNHDKNIIPYFGQRFTLGWNGIKARSYSKSSETIMKSAKLNHISNYSGVMGFQFGKKRFRQFIEFSYSFREDYYFSSWLKNEKWSSTTAVNNSFNVQVTYGFVFGPKSK